MKYNYVAIEREYGSGGTKIGRQLAQELGLACYGREILEMVSVQQGIPVEKIDRYEETITDSFLYSLFVMGKVQSSDPDVVTREGYIHAAEQKAIREMAAQGSCVFVGHCASEALSRQSDVLKVFILSDKEDKSKRILQDYRIPKDSIDSTMRRFDKKRANYYYANTTRRWNDYTNYDLVLNSGRLGIEGCVEVLRSMLKK
ncbi:MAG: cytidylate kinase-like family protein [Eubacteriales bacterium]|nr:cytidylate kinase-like family protein [Eubacteriales bacterium]